jgi:hypothetical protein
MVGNFFDKKESAMKIQRVNGLLNTAPAGMVDADHICRTVERALASIEQTGSALVMKALVRPVLERLGND